MAHGTQTRFVHHNRQRLFAIPEDIYTKELMGDSARWSRLALDKCFDVNTPGLTQCEPMVCQCKQE